MRDTAARLGVSGTPERPLLIGEAVTLARKGTRRIIVDSAEYRWTIDANDELGLGIVVELAEAPKQRMVTWVNHGNIVTPVVVRHCILSALEQGWSPTTLGPQLRYRIQVGVASRPEAF